jgi:hypothetical protein
MESRNISGVEILRFMSFTDFRNMSEIGILVYRILQILEFAKDL